MNRTRKLISPLGRTILGTAFTLGGIAHIDNAASQMNDGHLDLSFTGRSEVNTQAETPRLGKFREPLLVDDSGTTWDTQQCLLLEVIERNPDLILYRNGDGSPSDGDDDFDDLTRIPVMLPTSDLRQPGSAIVLQDIPVKRFGHFIHEIIHPCGAAIPLTAAEQQQAAALLALTGGESPAAHFQQRAAIPRRVTPNPIPSALAA